MEALVLKPRPVQDEIECWDDDDDLQVDDMQLTSTATNAFVRSGAQRDSISSRLSLRSDFESIAGADEERQVLLPDDDERATSAAIASAIGAGIPIPQNVPSSALLGGTIKRLGSKKSRQVLGDDWGEDLELPNMEAGGLKIKNLDGAEFPDVLQSPSASSATPYSPGKPDGAMSFAARMNLRKADEGEKFNLDKFRDQGDVDDDDFFGDSGDVATIKMRKERSSPKLIPFMSTPLSSNKENFDDFEQDLELPADGAPLKLSTRKEIPQTPAQLLDDLDEWVEGSLGTRHGGTRRDGRSPRSSSISAMSPSMSSSYTVESEDEGLDGLVLPDGPLNFEAALKKRRQTVVSPDPVETSNKPPSTATQEPAMKDDFFAGIEIGDGDVFDSAKLTLNRNIKHKLNRSTSPLRRTAMTLTFTNKPSITTASSSSSVSSRIPRPLGASDRMTSTLEPVSEVGGPMPNGSRRTQSRLGGHSAQTSVSSIPLPPTPSRTTVPSTPTRHRDLRTRPSMSNLKTSEPASSTAHHLKMKRSMPAMRPAHVLPPPRGPSAHQRPPSRAEGGSGSGGASRSSHPSRPKTPIDRSGAESSLGHGRKPPVPFLPAGTSSSQSHHVSAKPSRNSRRHDSESSVASADVPGRSTSRARAAAHFTHRSPSPRRRDVVASESLAREAAAKRTLVQPAKRRYFGNGSELEVFDDLPTSASNENRFLKAPSGRGAPKVIRNKLGLPPVDDLPERTSTPVVVAMPMSPSKEYTPRFARDTNSSRLAREQRTGVPMTPLSTNWKASMMPPIRGGAASGGVGTRGKRRQAGMQKKPHLIKPLGDTHNNAKSVKGMHYNPALYRWEGNENALAPFEALPSTARYTSPQRGSTATRPHLSGVKPDPMTTAINSGNQTSATTTLRPALITNITAASPSVQVVGGMVFDPQRMCWLKLSSSHHPVGGRGPPSHSLSLSHDELDFIDDDEDEDDPFADLPDLPTTPTTTQTSTSHHHHQSHHPHAQPSPPHHHPRQSSHIPSQDDDFPAPPPEEFDVGPEFIRRQRAEESRWRKMVEVWTSSSGTTHGSGSNSSRKRGTAAEMTTTTGQERRDDDEWRWLLRK